MWSAFKCENDIVILFPMQVLRVLFSIMSIAA
jgi:hypothetical protein